MVLRKSDKIQFVYKDYIFDKDESWLEHECTTDTWEHKLYVMCVLTTCGRGDQDFKHQIAKSNLVLQIRDASHTDLQKDNQSSRSSKQSRSSWRGLVAFKR